MINTGRLSENEKIEIIGNVKLYGNSWNLIGQLTNRNPSTVKSFYNSYVQHQTLSPSRGRPPSISSETKDGIIGSMMSFPTQNLQEVANDFDISITSTKNILNQQKIQYFEKTPIPPLTEAHKIERVKFTEYFINRSYNQIPHLIFSDESLVECDTKGGGIWRRPGDYPPESFYEKESHPTSVMIWGAIGPYGYRSQLLRFSGRVNSEYYCSQLANNRIFANLYHYFNANWVWQEDNAPPHRSNFTQTFIKRSVPCKLVWPARSPDLSPIEQVWDYMKNDISGIKFESKDQLFYSLNRSWNNIPAEKIHNIYSSFLARCIVCHNINGNSLNGHWKEVKVVHNQYRTKLCFYPDPFTGVIRPIELPSTISFS